MKVLPVELGWLGMCTKTTILCGVHPDATICGTAELDDSRTKWSRRLSIHIEFMPPARSDMAKIHLPHFPDWSCGKQAETVHPWIQARFRCVGPSSNYRHLGYRCICELLAGGLRSRSVTFHGSDADTDLPSPTSHHSPPTTHLQSVVQHGSTKPRGFPGRRRLRHLRRSRARVFLLPRPSRHRFPQLPGCRIRLHRRVGSQRDGQSDSRSAWIPGCHEAGRAQIREQDGPRAENVESSAVERLCADSTVGSTATSQRRTASRSSTSRSGKSSHSAHLVSGRAGVQSGEQVRRPLSPPLT